jgi:hypothetical protein
MQVTVNSPVSSGSLGKFPSQAAALHAIAEYIIQSVPPQTHVQIVRDGNTLSVYRVNTKVKRSFRHVTFKLAMQFEMKEI